MGDENPIRTLGYYSKPSHEGYRNTIELPIGNNVVPLRSDTIQLVQNRCSFHGLRSKDPNQHLKDLLKLVDSLDIDGENRERKRLRPSPQPQALDTTFEARVRDYMAAHTERMERFENTIFKQREEINGSDMNVIPYSTYTKLTDERPAETDIRLSLASHSYIYPLGIAEDVLVEVVEHVYHVDFLILDIRENKNRPFILGTPFLTTAKASRKHKISFHRIPDSADVTNKGVRNDIEPIAPTMTVNRLVFEWEEKIKLHLEWEMSFNQWRSKNFKVKHPTLTATKEGMDDGGEVT
ncbi:MAK10-like protein [Tanacetum coccineum]